MNQHHSPNSEAGKRPSPSIEWWNVFKKHLALFAEHYRQPISELSTIVYVEDLHELTPAQLDAACIHARKTSEYMPVSAAILKAHRELQSTDRGEYLGPPLLEYPPITDEERAAALEFSEQLKKKLGLDKPAPKPAAEPKKLTIVPSLRSLEEQKAELRRRGFLK